MFNHEIGFNAPYYLVLLLLIPVIWIWSFRSLAGLGPTRRFMALTFRTIILLLIVMALAEAQWRLISKKVTVLYLLDQSDSIPPEDRKVMLDYVRQAVHKHRHANDRDRAGVITFAREPAIEIPPFDDDISSQQDVETALILDKSATNLASALKLAQASFPEDSSKRVVIVTDGNENLGDARPVAKLMAEDGIGIDVVPIQLSKGAELAIERVVIPSDVREGSPFDVRVVVANYAPPGSREIKAKLRVLKNDTKLAEEDVDLKPGKNVFTFPETIDKPNAYTYKAEIVPADETTDYSKQNNVASGFTYVRGKGRVLFIVNPDSPDEYDGLVDALGREQLEVSVRKSTEAFNSLADLQGYDTVVLANVPRSAGGAADGGANINGFTDEQVKQLVANTENMGCGLVMLGGDESFGVGGWANTPLEEIMPVDFQIKNAEVKPNGALVLMMHASELAQGNYWQKVVGQESIRVLGPADYAGVIHWDNFTGNDAWLWKSGNSGLVQVGGQQKQMLSKMDRMQPGDMPQFEPAMQKALAAFRAVTGKAAVKHMIVISDGDPTPPNNGTVAAFRTAGIVISTVAIGTHGPAGSTPLKDIAAKTGGKYYVVTNPKALPTIYNKEVRRIARPLIYESKGAPLNIKMGSFPHEMLNGIDQLPQIQGFVLTQRKENPLVEVLAACEKPDDGGPNSTILASWTYKAGRTVVFTSDAGRRWATTWLEWPQYGKFFAQMIRWSMRPVNEAGKFTIATEVKDGKMKVVVNALDDKFEFLNNLNMSASATSPDLKTTEIVMRQEAPGRYVGEMDASTAGSYFIAVNPGKDAGGTLLTGANVPYSSEYREREHNQALLVTLASMKPDGGEEGKVIEGIIDPKNMEPLLGVDTFRRTLKRSVSIQDIWPWMVLLGACLFLGDVFVRRVAINFEWVSPVVREVKRRLGFSVTDAPKNDIIERLRSRKASIAGEIDERRAATRFAPDLSEASEAASDILAQASGDARERPAAPSEPRPGLAAGQAEEKTYTDRLLEAKRKARKDAGGDTKDG